MGFWVIKSSKKIFCKQNIHQKLFFLQIKFTSKSDLLSNLFVRNLADSKFFYSKLSSCKKNGSKSDAFKIPDSKHDASYKKCFKNRLFSKSLIQFLFLSENIFFRNKFSKNAQKSQHWRLYGVYSRAKLFFESQFSKKSWFSNNTFFIEDWCVVNNLTQVLTLCGNQFKFDTKFFIFLQKPEALQKKLSTFLIKTWRVVKRCFKIWHAVKSPFPKITSCLKLTKNQKYFENLDSKSDAL